MRRNYWKRILRTHIEEDALLGALIENTYKDAHLKGNHRRLIRTNILDTHSGHTLIHIDLAFFCLWLGNPWKYYISRKSGQVRA